MSQKRIFEQEVVRWWGMLHPTSGYNGFQADLSALHRCHSVSDVMFVPAFHRLVAMNGTELTDVNTLHSLAVAAWVLSWVDENRDMAFSEQLATNDPPVRQVRFRRLLECSSWDELGTQLIRMVRLMKNAANVSDLSQGILSWMSGTWVQERWALKYYASMPEEKKNS